MHLSKSPFPFDSDLPQITKGGRMSDRTDQYSAVVALERASGEKGGLPILGSEMEIRKSAIALRIKSEHVKRATADDGSCTLLVYVLFDSYAQADHQSSFKVPST